jgi:hypothetical protein
MWNSERTILRRNGADEYTLLMRTSAGRMALDTLTEADLERLREALDGALGPRARGRSRNRLEPSEVK